MSKFSTISHLRKELNSINHEIDHRILRGQPYQRLAQKHKQITSKIDSIWNQMNFTRAFRFLSLL